MSEPKVSPESIALRAPPRPVTRLNRRMIAVVVGLVAGAILGATLWSLESGRKWNRDPAAELHNVDRIAHADALDQLPSDYSKIAPTSGKATARPPLLGEPLPGDLGGAALDAQRRAAQGGSGLEPAQTGSTGNAAQNDMLARQREADDAAKAPIFFRSTRTISSGGLTARDDPSEHTGDGTNSSGAQRATTLSNADTSQGAQNRKSDVLERAAGVATQSGYTLQAPRSGYRVMAGTIIPAALITGINSDLPGKVLATVTEAVYDSATGMHLLIPQGARLIGQYDSQISAGQQRVLLVWTRLIFPDASSINLDRLPGVDASGYSGLSDGVDRHWSQILAAAALSTLIGVGSELAATNRSSNQNEIVVSTRQSVQDTANQVGQELTRRNINVQPTLTIRPGALVRVIVDKDISFPPYRQSASMKGPK